MKKEGSFTPLYILIVVLFFLGLGMNAVITNKIVEDKNLEIEYNAVWGKENYEKVVKFGKIQYLQQLANVPDEELDKAIAELEKQIENKKTENTQGEEINKKENIQEDTDTEKKPTATKQKVEVSTVIKPEYMLGNSEAEITLYEYSDIDCPYCLRLHDSKVSEKLMEEYKGKLNYAFKHFPIDQLHPMARMKAETTLCVAEQEKDADKYYAFISQLFGSRASSKEAILNLVGEYGVDKEKVATCIDNGTYKDSVQATLDEGSQKFGITGTPGSVLINNKTGEWIAVKGAAPYESFKQAVESLISK